MLNEILGQDGQLVAIVASVVVGFLFIAVFFMMSKGGEGKNRAPLVEDPGVEDAIYNDPEEALMRYQSIYGTSFRYITSGGKTTNIVTDKALAEQILKTRPISFYEASRQSKHRFGLREIVKDVPSVSKLSNYFRKAFMGTKTMEYFETRIVENLEKRMNNYIKTLPKNFTKITLSDLVGNVVFAASVDAIFGYNNGIFSQAFYADYMIFREAIGRRSAPMGGAKLQQEAAKKQAQDVLDARARMMKVLRGSRVPGGDAADCIQKIQEMLPVSDNELDFISLVLVWGANINSHPSSIWLIARLLQNPDILEALRKERAQVTKSKYASADDIKDRPLLAAVISESLRLNSRPNMYRVCMEDCVISTENKELKLKEGEWVWMFPRFYLHHNPEEYPEPEKFKPFERFGPEKQSSEYCPFRAGVLRVFGGGTVPCPGKDYAVFLLKAAMDYVLLSDAIDLKLFDPTLPLPAPAKQTVASTPPPSEDIYAEVKPK